MTDILIFLGVVGGASFFISAVALIISATFLLLRTTGLYLGSTENAVMVRKRIAFHGWTLFYSAIFLICFFVVVIQFLRD